MNQHNAAAVNGKGSLVFSIHLLALYAVVQVLCSGCAVVAPTMAPVLERIIKDPKTQDKIVTTTTNIATNAVDWGKGAVTNVVSWTQGQFSEDEKPLAIREKNPTHFVSVKHVVLRSQPTELSDKVAVLEYKTGVKAVEDVSVQLPFEGDPDLFSTNLVPHWAKVAIEDTTGYLPFSSLADAELMEKQNPDDPALSIPGETNERAVNGLLSSWRPVADAALGAFLRDGDLSGSMPDPVAEPLPDAAGGVGTRIGSGLRGAWSGAKNLLGGKNTAKATEPVVFDKIGPLQEFQFGRAIAARIAALHPVLSPDDPRSAYVAQVGAAIASASNDPVPFHGYLFAVMDSPEVDAFAVPGGFVFVTTGMLDFLQNEDELASVLAREVAHLELRHVRKAVGDEKLLPFFTELKKSPSSLALSEPIDEAFELVRDGCGVETEGVADWRAVQLAARVGYDPRSLGDVLGRFASAEDEMPYNGANQAEARASDVRDYLDAFGFSNMFFKGADVRAARYERSIRQ